MFACDTAGKSVPVVSPVVDPDGIHAFSYVVVTPGWYQLTIRHDGRHIEGSPFTLLACVDALPKREPLTIDSLQTTCGALKRPASSPASRKSFAVFSSQQTEANHRPLQQAASWFQTKRRPNTTRQVGVEEDRGSLVLGYAGTMDYDGTASLVLRVGRHGRRTGEFINPQGLCCTQDGKLVAVVDSYNACVQVS